MADNGYDPRAQVMEEIHFDWRCIVCCMVALSPLHLEQQHLPGTESVYFDLDNTPWIKCDKCHTPFHLQCGTWESVYVVRSKRFLCTFSGVDSFRSPCCLFFSYSPPFPMSLVFQIPSLPLPCHLCFVYVSQSFDFKMGCKRMCPDSDKKKKKSPKRHTEEAGKKDRGDSAHANQQIGLFTAEEMKACIDEIKEVEQRAKDEGKKPKFSRNEICEKHGISPSSVSKQMTGKVKGYGPQLGGARRGKILSEGMFK